MFQKTMELELLEYMLSMSYSKEYNILFPYIPYLKISIKKRNGVLFIVHAGILLQIRLNSKSYDTT